MHPIVVLLLVIFALGGHHARGHRCRSVRPAHPPLPVTQARAFAATSVADCAGLPPLDRAYCLNLLSHRLEATQRRDFTGASVSNNVTSPVLQRSTNNCTDADNSVCELCCNGECCQKVTDAAAPSQTTFTEVSGSTTAILVLPLAITLITPVGSSMGLSTSDIQEQLRILNIAYAPTRVRFVAHSYQVIQDSTFASYCNTDPCYVNPATCGFYAEVLPRIVVGNRSATKAVNVVLCSLSYVGEAQLPWIPTNEASPVQYIQVQYGAWANKATAGTYFDGGKTLVHEMGHYVGLLHTFEKEYECDISGDYVADTYNSKTPAAVNEACSLVTYSCSGYPGAGPDDRSNYMNYARDSCMVSFTAGQIARLEAASIKYRPLLVQSRLLHGSCPAMSQATPNYNLEACVCDDPTLSPLTFCGLDSSGFSDSISLFLEGSSRYVPGPPPPTPNSGGEVTVPSSSNALLIIIIVCVVVGVAVIAGVGVLVYCFCCRKGMEERAARRREAVAERKRRADVARESVRQQDMLTRARIRARGEQRQQVALEVALAPPPPSEDDVDITTEQHVAAPTDNEADGAVPVSADAAPPPVLVVPSSTRGGIADGVGSWSNDEEMPEFSDGDEGAHP